jgi:hypothetical protein
MSNKLTTLGYNLKRFRDNGYYTHKVFTDYARHDPRAWTIMIDPGCASIFCTCYVNAPEYGDSYFELYDGGQFIPGRLKIKTNSFEVLVEHLVRYGINNKAPGYDVRNGNRDNT